MELKSTIKASNTYSDPTGRCSGMTLQLAIPMDRNSIAATTHRKPQSRPSPLRRSDNGRKCEMGAEGKGLDHDSVSAAIVY
jgi:hypothetical protein